MSNDEMTKAEINNGEINRDETNRDDRHSLMLKIFAALMIAHWSEHLVQAYQVYALGYERHHARGLLGQIYPWLMHSEWLHFGFAVLTFAGLLMLVRGFKGPARTWWNVALIVQTWHLFEHTLLFAQAQGGFLLWGAKEPTSVLQLLFPRIELHLFYNSVVTVPIVAAMLCWRRDRKATSPSATAGHDAVSRSYAPAFRPQSHSMDEGGI